MPSSLRNVAHELCSQQVNPGLCSIQFGRKASSIALRIICDALLTLARAPQHHLGPHISELIFNACKLSDRQMDLLGNLMGESKDLQTLIIVANDISMKGMGALADGIRKSKSLNTLEFHSNSICSEEARRICYAMGASTSLKSISFVHCKRFAYVGMIGIAYGIGMNPILRELNINHCWLGAGDACSGGYGKKFQKSGGKKTTENSQKA